MFPTFAKRLMIGAIPFLVFCSFPSFSQPANQVIPKPAHTASAQVEKTSVPATQTKPSETKPLDSEVRARRWLQSNDLLVETPYTQERGEVQHTFKFGRTRHENWASTFTQEWPILSEKHQLTFSLPAQVGRNDEGGRGVGDAVVEYTYQLLGGNESRLTISPKIGLSVPTGKASRELGSGAPGIALSVPVGLMLAPSVGIISNVSAGVFGQALNSEGEAVRRKFLEVGQSLVWYAHPRLNALLEAKWERAIAVEDNGHRLRKDELFLAPGLRWAHLVGNKIALMPGISVPIGIGASRGDRGILFSLAIEHPFGKRRE